MRVSVKDKGEKNEENLWDGVWTDRPTIERFTDQEGSRVAA